MVTKKVSKSKKKNLNKGDVIKPKSKTILKRKQLRLDKRKGKKLKKVEYFKNKYTRKFPLKPDEDENITSSEDESNLKSKKSMSKAQSNAPTVAQVNNKTEKEMKELKRQQKKQRKRQLRIENEREQENIAKLEKQLGLKRRKSKNLPKSFEEDGLSYILNVCDSGKIESLGDELSDDEDLTKLKKFKEDLDKDSDSNQENSDLDESIDYEGSDDVDEDDFEDDADMSDVANCDKVQYDADFFDDGDDDHISEDDDRNTVENDDCSKSASQSDEWEDIYGRKRNADGVIIEENTVDSGGSKYIPPALRKKMELENNASEEKRAELSRLLKQLKGLLNRLAESNMSGISKQVEGFYLSNSRNDVSQTLTNIFTTSLVAPSLTPSRLVLEHAMLIAILHANVGTEVGGHLLQALVKLFASTYSTTDLDNEDSKELDNILVILSYFHAFKIVSSLLILEILDELTESFRAKDIELIMIVLRNCGFVLRKEDPIGLKNLILKVQSKASECTKDESRVSFMLEILTAIKNNNVNKIPNYDPSHFEHMKKIFRSFLREGNFVTELKIGYKDLIQADSRGRWWIVGSAFNAHLAGGEAEDSSDIPNPRKAQSKQQFSSELLSLARKMRMNTETRRQIFCLLMTGEDFMDATEKLVKLGTKNQTERDVAFVVLACCVQEKVFNPYYCHVASKLSSVDRKYRIATQFNIWDRIKLIPDMKLFQRSNLAKFVSFLIKDKSQSLGVLKVIEFAEMNKHNVKFLREVLLDVLLEAKEEEVRLVFKAVAESEKLAFFRESLKLFLHFFLLKQSSKLPPETDKELLISRVAIAEQEMMSRSGKGY